MKSSSIIVLLFVLFVSVLSEQQPQERRKVKATLPKEPKVPEATETPKGLKAPKEPKTPKEQKTPKQTSKALKAPKEPKTPKEQKTPKEPKTSKQAPKALKTPKEPKTRPAKAPKEPKEPKSSITSFLWQKIGNDIDGERSVDNSGYSVSLSSDGNTVAVGAPLNDGTLWYGDSGHVRVFQWTESTSTWTQKGADINGKALHEQSGYSVSLSSDGNIVAVGAPVGDRVRIYQWSESTSAWTQMGADIGGGGSSGWSVSLSSDGNIVAVGAPNSRSGHVRIFQWIESASAWTQKGGDIYGDGSGDYSGRSVSLSSDGNIVAIGAPLNGALNDGHVRIFQWRESASAWTQMGLNIQGETVFDYSGISVSLSSDGNTVAIGARENTNENGATSGHVRIFQWIESASSWTQMGADINGERPYDKSGLSLSLSSDGKTVAIGTPWNNGNGPRSGHVRIFQWTEYTSTWTQVGADIDGERKRNHSGRSVSLSSDGKTVAIGADLNSENGYWSGHVRIFQWKRE